METFFSNFNLVFELANDWKPKTFKRITSVNIDQILMCYISMDLSWEDLQALESFIQISNVFSNYWQKTKKYSMNNKVGFMQARWGRHLCWSALILV